MFSKIDAFVFFFGKLDRIYHIESQLWSDPFKEVNQGVLTPENGFLENPCHVFKDRHFWVFL